MEPKKIEILIEGYPQQMELINSRVDEIAFIAGLGGGKTHAGAMKMLERQYANPGSSAIVTAPSYRIMEMATLDKYEKIYPPEFVKKKKLRPYPVWELFGGGKIYFYSTDNPASIVGGEVAFVHMDEASLSPYLSYTNCKKRMRQRDKEGKPYPYQLWITTTPRQLNWVYLEFGPDRKDGHQLITASTRDNVFRDKIEIEEYIRKLGLSELEESQEIEGNFEILAGDCLFRKDSLDMQLKNCEPPIETRDFIQIWKEPVVGVHYIAAADCADEGGEGVNSLIILDPQTGDEVAEINADIAADKFAGLSYDLLSEYDFPLFAPERNATVGGMVIQKMLDLNYPNLYYDLNHKPGWYTSTRAIPPKVDRLNMLKDYEEAVRLRRTIIRSSDAIGEMSTFVRDNKGKYKHLQGRRDDRIMARAICWQLRKVRPRGSLGFASFKRSATTY